MRPLAFKLIPWEFFENFGIFSKIVENLNFASWKKVFLNFLGPPRLNQERYSALVFFYLTTTDKLEFTDWFWVRRMFGCGENAFLKWRRMIAPPAQIRVNTPIVAKLQIFLLVQGFWHGRVTSDIEIGFDCFYWKRGEVSPVSSKYLTSNTH